MDSQVSLLISYCSSQLHPHPQSKPEQEVGMSPLLPQNGLSQEISWAVSSCPSWAPFKNSLPHPRLPWARDISHHTVGSRKKTTWVHCSPGPRRPGLWLAWHSISRFAECLAHNEPSSYTCWMNEWGNRRRQWSWLLICECLSSEALCFLCGHLESCDFIQQAALKDLGPTRPVRTNEMTSDFSHMQHMHHW